MMSFKSFLDEMTMKAGDLSPDLKRIFARYDDLTDEQLTHVGDLNDVKVLRREEGSQVVDLLARGQERIGFASGQRLKTGQGEMLELESWYIIPEAQRQDLGYKYLYFLKNVLHERVLLGGVHSTATQEFLKKQHHLKRFKLSWYNLNTGEVEPFEASKYELTKKNSWQILIESDAEAVFNQFNDGQPSLKNSYDWLFDGLDEL